MSDTENTAVAAAYHSPIMSYVDLARRTNSRLDLAVMWVLAGQPAKQRPIDWLDLEETHRLLMHLGQQGDLALCENSASFDFGMSYGLYLDPGFHMWVNDQAYAAIKSGMDFSMPDCDVSRELQRQIQGEKTRH